MRGLAIADRRARVGEMLEIVGLPLEIFAMTTNVTSPALYALGTLTTVFSASIILIAFFAYSAVIKRQRGQA